MNARSKETALLDLLLLFLSSLLIEVTFLSALWQTHAYVLCITNNLEVECVA